MVDRAELSRLLAQAIAYKNCGKDEKAEAAGNALLRALIANGIVSPMIQFGDLR